MKKHIRRFIALCLSLAIVAGFIPAIPATPTAEAATYDSYTTIAKVKTQGDCSGMQGMDIDGNYIYCAKVDGDDTVGTIARVHKSTGEIVWMTNAATGTKYFYNIYHANDLAICSVNGVKTLFVGTGGAGAGEYSLVRFVIDGTTLTEVGHYNMQYNGSSKYMAGVKVVAVDSSNVTLITKQANYVFTAKIPVNATGGTIAMNFMGTLDFSAVNFNGTIKDISDYVQQGFGYKDNKIFVPMSANHQDSTSHISTIVCFDIDGGNGTIKPDPNMSVWIADTTYADLFEIESCAISPNDGKLYFGTNCRITSTDGNHDGIHVLNGFTYSPTMGDSTVGQNYRWETMNNKLVSTTKDGSVYNSALIHEGSVSGNTITAAKWSLDKPVILKHSDPWIIEWKASNWNKHTMLLSTYDTSGYTGNRYLYRRSGSGLIALGYQGDGNYHNYGVLLSDHGIDDTVAHTYRLQNKINADGTNMVYLSVDGTELGAMNNYYLGATSQGTTDNWVNGQDFAFSYIGTNHLVGGKLDYLQVYTRGQINAVDEPNIFRWETQNNAMTGIAQVGYTNNATTVLGGTCTGGTYADYYNELAAPVTLRHDRPWVLEWESTSWSGSAMLLASGDTSAKYYAPYLFRSSNSISFGYSDGTRYHNHGLRLTDYGIDATASHIYRLTNKINADGSNMVYVSVDGQELGPMNSYFIGNTAQGTTTDWISGQDFTFMNMGTLQHSINQPIGYIQVWEDGIPSAHISDQYRWEAKDNALFSISSGSFHTNTADRIGGTVTGSTLNNAYFRLSKSVVLLHNSPWTVSWQSSGAWTTGGFLFSASFKSNEINAPYLYRRANSDLIGFGCRTADNQHVNYGLKLSDHGIDGTATHTYTLTNRINADGTNMVYLSVDGQELGPMDRKYVGGTYQNTTDQWISGKDFVFPYIGSPQFDLVDVTLNYLEVNEGVSATGTVVFKDWDGTVLSSTVYNVGDTVTAPSSPTRPSDGANSYIFAGWDKTVTACNGDAVYVATYTATPITYTVTFKDYDGTVLSSETYHYGDQVTAPADPVRPSDGTYLYTFSGWTPAVTACTGDATYTATYTATGVPVLTPDHATLSFEDQIQINIYFTFENLDVALSDIGLLTWSYAQENGTIETAEAVTPGAVASGDKYFVHTPGIPAKNMGNVVYFKVYARLNDGTYLYSQMFSYSPKTYAQQQIATSPDPNIRALCVAMLNYGAAAQTYFQYQPYALMNSDVTAEQQSYVTAYGEYMIDPVVAVSSSKTGNFPKTGGYFDLHPSVSFEGAFSINYYATPDVSGASNLSLYYWYADTYNSVSALTTSNADGAITMELLGGQYVANVAGIAAKDLDKTLYVAVVYEYGGVRYCSGVIAYSVGRYLEQIAANTSSDAQPLAAAAAVYSYYAKLYFSSLA